jgi:hypothetical protein
MNSKVTTTVLIAGLLLLTGAASAQQDPLGKTDTVTLAIEKLQPGKWVVIASVWNDEEIAAIDIPIKYTAGVARLNIDSVSYAGTRMEYFAQKYNPIDTANQIMHFGGFAYMGPDKPPMAPGSGEVARVYISVIGDKKPGVFAVDTCFMAPNSSLMLVDKNAKIIVPALKILDKADVEKKEKKEKKKETTDQEKKDKTD